VFLIGEILLLRGGEAVFVDEIHSVGGMTMEYLKVAMEGGKAGNHQVTPPWTLIGASSDPGKIPLPVRDRFGLILFLDYYTEDETATVTLRSAAKLNMELQPKAANEIAVRARGVPRIANRLLRRVRDFSDSPPPE